MKRLISALLCLALLLSMAPVFGASAAAGTAWDGRTSEAFAGGSGTAEDPFQIANGAQLYQLALIAGDSTMASNVYTATKDTCYVLTANIDMGNKIFPGIAYFSGTLDGAGYRIYNLNIKNTATDYTGLVRSGAKCTLRNLTVEGTISGTKYTGGIAGELTSGSTLANCTNYCTVSGSERTGGICGYSVAKITGCRNMGTVSGSSYVGGIVGFTYALVTSCVNMGAVTGSSSNVGGVVGYCDTSNTAYSSLCVNAGEVKGYNYVAGICGYIYLGSFENCYNIGKITATYGSAYTCGIAYYDYNSKGYVRLCYNAGTLSGGSTRYGVSNYCRSYCYYLSGTASSSGYSSSYYAVKLTAEEMTSAGAFIGFDFLNTWTWDNTGAYDFPILKNIGLVLTPCSEDTHQWNEGTVATAATCTSTGSLLLTCVKCKETKSQEIPALGHDLKEIPAISATCTEAGMTAGTCCSRCDYRVEGTVIPATGHNYETTTPPSCAEGYPVYTCTVCGHSYTDTSVEASGHDLDEGVIERAPTCVTPGLKVYTCLTCGNTKTETIPALGHDYSAKVTAPTCTAEGFTTYTCATCGESYNSDVVAALGHSYEKEITSPTCTEVGFTTYTCSVCGHNYNSDVVAATGHDWDAGVITINPGCDTNGKKVYTCRLCGITMDETVVATGHTYSDKVTKPTCTEVGYTTHTCSSCGHSYKDTYVGATGHAWNQGIEMTKATCTDPGQKVYTCVGCGITKSEPIPATGHTYQATVTAPTCISVGYTTHTCSACGHSYKDTYVDMVDHVWSWAVESPKATCTEPGRKVYTCVGCGQTKAETIPALGHSYTNRVTAPTCTEAGSTTYTCSSCGHVYTDDYVEATGHSWDQGTVKIAATCTVAGQTVYTCGTCKQTKTENVAALGHSYEEAVTAPTCTAKGISTFTCTACGDSYTHKETPATGHSFASGSCTVCGEKDPNYVISNPFTDVKESDYFYDPVLWAVEKGITTGVTKTTFGPEKPCTRGQVVTFLWRASGSPKATNRTNPFTDVPSNAYYYEAVLWAVEKGITTGVTKTTFGPDKTCTRGQVATFLWRAQDKPAPTTTHNPFTDISETEYYYSAVLWAVEKGVTNGISKTAFGPDKDCTRGQIVTFLYRALKEEK